MTARAIPVGYREGSRVVGIGFLMRGKAGRITKVGRGVTAMVTWDGTKVPERVYLESLRHETAEDVAARERHLRMGDWRRRQPSVNIVQFKHPNQWGGANDVIGVMASASTPAEMREAALELAACAAWFEEKPR